MTLGSQSFDSTSICLSTREKAYATTLLALICFNGFVPALHQLPSVLLSNFMWSQRRSRTSRDLILQANHLHKGFRWWLQNMYVLRTSSFWDHVPAWYLSKRTPAVSVAITWSEPAMTSTYPIYIYIIIEHNLIIISYSWFIGKSVALSWRLKKRQTGGGSTWIICSRWLPPCHCLQDQRAEGNAHLILATKWTVQRAPWRHRASGVSGVSERMDNDSFELHMLPQVAGLENI